MTQGNAAGILIEPQLLFLTQCIAALVNQFSPFQHQKEENIQTIVSNRFGGVVRGIVTIDKRLPRRLVHRLAIHREGATRKIDMPIFRQLNRFDTAA